MQQSILPSLLVFLAFVACFGLVAFLFVWSLRRMRTAEPRVEDGRCRFHPAKLMLKGQHGDVLRGSVRLDGPPGMAFTTYAEEGWWVALPASGMTPQDIEIIAYTEHAPPGRRQTLLLRVFPADVHLPIDELHIELRLRRPKAPPATSRAA